MEESLEAPDAEEHSMLLESPTQSREENNYSAEGRRPVTDDLKYFW